MDNGKGVSAGCMRIRYSSPRKAMARWFSSPGKAKGRKIAKAKVSLRDFGCDMVKTRICPENSRGDVEHSDSLPHTIDSEINRRDVLFMGVSCCLLHLIATGREEIQKISELRNELEKVLECHNGDLLRKQQELVKLRDDLEKFLVCHNDELQRRQQEFLCERQEQSETSAYSTTTDVLDGPESFSDHHYSPQITETSTRVGHKGSLQHYMFNRRDDTGEEMDKLEAELEAEFELLQISQNQAGKHAKLKEIAKNSDEESEDLTLEYIGPRPVEEQGGGGVCPYELTGRLYELMETRQEEEIKELKTALEDAKHRLHFMETEVSMWKNKAYIVSEHIPEPSRITFNSGTHRHPLSR